jgi:hypothetical protein
MDQTSNILSPPELTPLEQDVLDEYERLAENMKKVSRAFPSSYWGFERRERERERERHG